MGVTVRTISVLLGVIILGALAACSPKPALRSSTPPSVAPLAPGALSTVPSSSLPPKLTAGEPDKNAGRGNLEPVGIQWRDRILANRRLASASQATRYIGFTPRMPTDTQGGVLEYLLVEPWQNGAPDHFHAFYSGGALQIAEWSSPANVRWQPLGMVATQTVHGQLATVNPDQQGQAFVRWKEDGKFFIVWFSGSLQDALRIAESFPRR